MLDWFNNIEIKRNNLDEFNEIAKNYLCLFISESEFSPVNLDSISIENRNDSVWQNIDYAEVKIKEFNLESSEDVKNSCNNCGSLEIIDKRLCNHFFCNNCIDQECKCKDSK